MTINSCELSAAVVGLKKHELESWHLQVNQSNFQQALLRTKFNAHFTSISKEELMKLSEHAKAAGMTLNQSTIDQLIVEGEKSLLQEKARCISADNRNDLLGEVHQQEDSEWCYAFSAADLLTSKLGKKISAFDLALAYNDSWKNDLSLFLGIYKGEFDISNGHTNRAIEKGLKRGLCLEERLPSEHHSFHTLKEQIHLIEELKQKNKDPHQFCEIECDILRDTFPTLPSSQLEKVFNSSFSYNLIDRLADADCAPRVFSDIPIKVTNIIAEKAKHNEKLFRKIDQQLESGNIIEVVYDSNLLRNLHYEGDASYHSSLIVGSRFNSLTNNCEYLVRNSWGKGCQQYDKNLACEAGNIWIPKKDLARSIQYIDYLD